MWETLSGIEEDKKKWKNLSSFSMLLRPWDDDVYRTSGGYNNNIANCLAATVAGQRV